MADQLLEEALGDLREGVEVVDAPESAPEDRDERAGLIQRLVQEAVDHYEENIEPDQVKATDYYYGRPFGNEKEGRSRVVSTDLRDTTRRQIPSMMRVVYGPDRVVEFEGEGMEDAEVAAQITDYVRYVVTRDNPGYLIHRNWIKDGLVRRLGIVKLFWEEDVRDRQEIHSYEGLTEEQLTILSEDPDIERVEITYQGSMEGLPAPELAPDAPEAPPQPMQYDVNVWLSVGEDHGRLKIVNVPNEEFMFTPGAVCLEDADAIVHSREMTVAEALAMGLDEVEVREAAGRTREGRSDEDLAWTRQVETANQFSDDDADRDDNLTKVLVTEAYVLVTDEEDDTLVERRKFICLGPHYDVMDEIGDPVDMIPFFLYTPDPEPHTIIGLSNWDLVGDVQLIKSQVQRATLDSLSQAIDSITEVVNGEVNMGDLLKPDVNKIVRVTRPGMMREVKHHFVGDSTLPVLSYFDEVKDSRTSQTKASQGLDADALQSSTKAAVAATMSASQQSLEDMVQVFAETAMAPLYMGVAKMLIKHQDVERMVRLRNKYVPMDPRTWDLNMDVRVNVALGQGTPEDRLIAAEKIIAAQEKLLAAGSPLVSTVELRNALADATELAGHRHPDRYFKPWSEQDEQQMQQQMQQQEPPPDPGMALVKVEEMKMQLQAQMDMQKAQLEEWKARMEDDRERDKQAQDFELKKWELEMKYQAQINDAELKAEVARDRAVLDADVKVEMARNQPAPDIGPQ